MRLFTKLSIGAILVLSLIFITLQFVPVQADNPPVIAEPNWDSPQTRELMVRACYDCHSNETVWPWYSRVAPASWLIAKDVNDGRAELNYSEWSPYHDGEAEEAVEMIVSGEMPLRPYLLLHPEAKLTEAEVTQLITGLQATFAGSGDDIEAEDAARERLERDDADDDDDAEEHDYNDDEDDSDDESSERDDQRPNAADVEDTARMRLDAAGSSNNSDDSDDRSDDSDDRSDDRDDDDDHHDDND